jgi:hypothetical protein
MLLKQGKSICVFILGMLTFAVGYFFVSTFIIVEKPTKDGIIEDWGQICFWSDADGLYASISPKGCYSTSCTSPKLQAGTAIVDVQNQKIQLEARFVHVKTSRFPLPCTDNCSGGGVVQFKLEPLLPNDYEVRFEDEKVGDLMIFSGRPTPRQCFENKP